MRYALFLRGQFFAVLAAISVAGAAAPTDYSAVSSAVAQVLEQGHYSKKKLTPELSRQVLANYLHDLDEDHLYFTQQDVDAITKAHADTLGTDALAGRSGAALESFDLYKKRVNERMAKIDALLKSGFDFTGDHTVELTREHSKWPADEADADRPWKNQLTGEMLDEKLNGSTDAGCVQAISARYKQSQAELLDQPQDSEAVSIFLNALVRTYDPHSEYLRPQDMDDLDSDMSLSMVGIGVVIEGDGRYVRIVSILPGSPAATDGRLKANDRILAIAKGDGDFIDIAGMSTDHVLSLMRSQSGTRIRLKVTASRDADASASTRRDIDLVSRPIDLVDDEAKAEVVERQLPDGKKERLGWITLPSFYGDPDHPHGKSVARDVRNLVQQLKRENVAGMVIDMRNNPGGELEEAVAVGGLFLGPVPIVQEKDRDGKIFVSKADGRAIYDGPLVVLTDHMTASAAELLAAALQDYGRAVMVGGNYSTYGKGSVQTVVDLEDVIENPKKVGDDLGAVQLTIAKFYRVNGQSTQLRGLTADIKLPSPEDLPEDGESLLDSPLAYDEIKPARAFIKAAVDHSLPVAQLKDLSAARIAGDEEFRYLAEDIDRETKKDQGNLLSLNEITRRAELSDETARDKQRTAARKLRKSAGETVVEVSLHDLAGKPAVPAITQASNPAVTSPDPAPATAAAKPDAMRAETLNILSDLIRLTLKKPPLSVPSPKTSVQRPTLLRRQP